MEHRDETTNLISGEKEIVEPSHGAVGFETKEPPERSTEVSGDEARQGVTGHNVRYVLMASCVLAAGALIVIVYMSA